MDKILLLPPVAFIIILAVSAGLIYLFGRLSFRPDKHTSGETTSYACGESTYDNKAQPDYSNFFSFAFFFTLAHVATLIVTTVPVGTLNNLAIVFIYIAGGAAGLYILFRR